MRRVASVLVAAACTLALTSCIFGGTPAVDKLENVGTATIRIHAEGTFIDPGTLESVEQGSTGSGFFVSSDGIAITNSDVVTGADAITVSVGGDVSQEVDARLVGASECLDLAVLQVDGKDFPLLGWYDGEIPESLKVYSAGFPSGEPDFALTEGSVSQPDAPQEDAWASLAHAIEHDARVRGGNAGGPLVAGNGRVVGVNYTGDDELDAGYAIHRDEVLSVLEALKKGDVQSLGVNAQALAPDGDQAMGVWVRSVKAGGPADLAGIEPGDVLVSMDGVTLAQTGTLEEYCELIRTRGQDAVIDVEVFRPADNGTYQGQFNGDELALVAGQADPVDPVGTFVTVSNDSDILSVEVPDSWTQIAGDPFTDSAGVTWDALTISPDLQAFATTYNVPGVALQSTPALLGTEKAAALESFTVGANADCTPDETGDYDDGFYVGRFATFTDCAGTDTSFAVVVADDVDNTHFMVVTVQMVSESDKTTVLDTILNSFLAFY